MNISLTLLHIITACIAFCGVIVGNSNGVSLYRWIVYKEPFRINPENKKISAIAIEWMSFVFGYLFLIYSFYGIEEQVRVYLFPPTAVCMQQASFDAAEKDGIREQRKFVNNCKDIGGELEFRMEEIVNKFKQAQFDNSLYCMQKDDSYAMDCMYNFMTNFPYEKDFINKLLDAAKTCVFAMKCTFDDDKKSMDYIFNRPQCGFGISDIKYITERNDANVKIKIEVLRQKMAQVKNPDTIKYCNKLTQLPSRVPSETQYKTYDKNTIAFGVHNEGMRGGQVDENTIVAIEYYNINVRNYFE